MNWLAGKHWRQAQGCRFKIPGIDSLKRRAALDSTFKPEYEEANAVFKSERPYSRVCIGGTGRG